MDDEKRLLECYCCVYMDECFKTIDQPEENENGACKSKENFNICENKLIKF